MSGRAPLAGIRVLEVGNYMAAPFCGMQLADLGAEVIKIEHPDGGDQVRLSAPLDRYVDSNSRHRNRQALASTIESVTLTRPAAHWLEVLGEAGVPCAPVQDFGQVFTDPHLLARKYFWDAAHPRAGDVRQLGSPMRFSLTPTRRDKAGPLLGEDSAALLTELGYGADEISGLVANLVVKTSR